MKGRKFKARVRMLFEAQIEIRKNLVTTENAQVHELDRTETVHQASQAGDAAEDVQIEQNQEVVRTEKERLPKSYAEVVQTEKKDQQIQHVGQAGVARAGNTLPLIFLEAKEVVRNRAIAQQVLQEPLKLRLQVNVM